MELWIARVWTLNPEKGLDYEWSVCASQVVLRSMICQLSLSIRFLPGWPVLDGRL